MPFGQTFNLRKSRAIAFVIVGTSSAANIREAILHEARTRLTTWFADKEALNLPFWASEAHIQTTKQWYWCDVPGGTNQVPVSFGEFNSTLRPEEIFGVLSDGKQQKSWDTTVEEISILGDFQGDNVRGMQLLMPSGIFMVPPREVFQWTAFNANFETNEFWFAFSTLETSKLREVRHEDRSAVQANNCLGAYWVRPCPAAGEHNCPAGNPVNCCPPGGSHLLFTQHVNVHPPPLISAESIFDMSWYKQIDWIDMLQKRVRVLQNSGQNFRQQIEQDLPAWLLYDTPGSASDTQLIFPARKNSAAVSRLFSLFSLKGHLQAPGWTVVAVTFVTLVSAVFALTARRLGLGLMEAACRSPPLLNQEFKVLIAGSDDEDPNWKDTSFSELAFD
mmetsp:Transcript_24725/g.44036  ORF Transcript_24725/g.44036 Transcript_24725/m.44036 type:complete len:390 (+) Transcript_24725:70-1239(+)